MVDNFSPCRFGSSGGRIDGASELGTKMTPEMYAADVNPFDAVFEGEAPPVEGLPEGDVNPFDAMFAEEAPKVQESNLTPGERREIIIKTC